MADNKSCEDNKRSIGELTIDFDAKDALKGLKAIQREARKAAKELKEVDSLQLNVGDSLRVCPVCEETCGFRIEKLTADGEVKEAKVICGRDNNEPRIKGHAFD